MDFCAGLGEMVVVAHGRPVERSFSPVDFFALPRHRVGHSQQDWGVGGGRGEDYRTQARQEPK